MTRRAIDTVTTLTAGILLVMGQGFLLIPQHFGDLLADLSVPNLLIAGFLLHFLAMGALAQVVIPLRTWKSQVVSALLIIPLAALSLALGRNGWGVETILFIGLILALLISILQKERDSNSDQRLEVVFASFLNLLIGAGLLAFPNLQSAAAQPDGFPFRTYYGTSFLAAALLGVYTLFRPRLLEHRIFFKLLSIPWFGWSLFAALARNIPSLIPAVAVAMILLTRDLIPWGRLKLPANDLLGKRFILLTAILQTIFLVAVTFLLDNAEISNVSSVRGWGLLHLSNRELAFLLVLGTESLLVYGLVSLVAILNGLALKFSGDRSTATLQSRDTEENANWNKRIERLLAPFATFPDTHKRVELQAQQIQTMSDQLAAEKRRTAQLTLLAELSQQLENQLDAPVASQLAVNTLQRSLNCSLVVLYTHEPEKRELVALAAAGTRVSVLPPGYRQSVNVGVLGRAARLRKTQVVNDSRLEPEFIKLNDEATLSTVAVPLIDHGHLKALLEISDDRANAFSSSDVQIAEAVAAELLRAWERSEYHQRLTELIQAGISLTTQPDPQAAVEEVAAITRQTLRARFAFVTLLDQEGNFTRTASAGNAPRLLKSLRQNPNNEPLMQAALNSSQSFRVRDIRKYKRASHIDIDFPSLRSMIAIPIRMHRLSVGAMLAFGKQGEVFFTENDESLASLLSSQAAAAIESAWLSHELRSNLASATQLYQLSFHIIQAQELSEAARYIAETAQKVCSANSTGIILLTPDNKVEAEAQLDSNGAHIPPAHPMSLVQRAIDSAQSIFISSENETSSICFPLKTPMRTFGALWLVLPDRNGSRFATNLQTLANQAAVALERSILLAESRQQARELEAAYHELETTYDHTLAALMSALDARDRETEGHSSRVAQIARKLGEHLDLTPTQLKALERGSLLHDIGKIGISDTILHKPGPLDAAEWKIMRLHPDIGARIVEGIPFLQDTLAVVRYHQERWDGSGYPVGLSGKDIPYLARIFAVADAFDALTSDRPYRAKIQQEEALQYLREQSGILFDPQIVQTLDVLYAKGLLAEEESK
jgi:HD-GYP domain-containing protein (c-di-GMP phosphodiesterase class II)/putative methionine-R-sulfoxide reductase with GAF domain